VNESSGKIKFMQDGQMTQVAQFRTEADKYVDDWRDYAECRKHDPELFYPLSATDPTIRQAQAICRRCPVFAQCAIAGRDERWGIWAGELKGAGRLGDPGTHGTERQAKGR
jgi:WhiB family redox-sensing transcriptional regulator